MAHELQIQIQPLKLNTRRTPGISAQPATFVLFTQIHPPKQMTDANSWIMFADGTIIFTRTINN